jgi:hypothetical protein
MSNLSKYIIFKPVPDGYVYRIPNAWVFGSGVHLLVDERQKAAIIRTMDSVPFVSNHSRFLGSPIYRLRNGSSVGRSTRLS